MANNPPLLKDKDKPKKKKSVSKLKKELDTLFSQYIRRKYANEKEEVSCYTCGRVMHWKQIQCGHLASRSYLSTRYDENNVRPQCVGCNVFGAGKVVVFATLLDNELGEGTVARLYRKAQEITKNFPYQEKITYYKEKLKQYE